MNQERRTVRCAIYTRKSSDEGLEQEFNSLDAQYEACSAYIASQRHEGWKRVSVRYDDGGVSGGTLMRPALIRLLADIVAGRVDLVVVYKIDRLTRSLMDFAKLVERFDKSGCSFVSVTQAFNTSTSMGRLTLNVLLSFAQFEREVTAERIRDKITASKKKGMWMGGKPPVGYTPRDRELIIDPAGAALVRTVFASYLEVRCLNRLKREVDRLGLRTRPSRSMETNGRGRPYSRGHLYAMLRNPIYIGQIRHKDQIYPGRHDPIIDKETWDRVQTMLETNGPNGRGNRRRAMDRSPLTGKLVDETSDRLTPSYTKKGDRRLRYFVSARLVERFTTAEKDRSGWRLPAAQLEEAVAAAVSKTLKAINAGHLPGHDVETIQRVSQSLVDLATGADRQPALLDLVAKVRVTPGSLEIELQPEKVASILETSIADIPASARTFFAPFQHRRRGVETKLIFGYQRSAVDAVLLRRVARGWVWWEEIRTGKASLNDIATRENVSARFIAIHLDLAFLAPDIVVSIVEGRQPAFLSAQTFRAIRIPGLWADQRKLLADLEAAHGSSNA